MLECVRLTCLNTISAEAFGFFVWVPITVYHSLDTLDFFDLLDCIILNKSSGGFDSGSMLRLVDNRRCQPNLVGSEDNIVIKMTSNQPGAVVYFRCRDGYSLSGSSSVRCASVNNSMSLWAWDTTAPQCYGKYHITSGWLPGKMFSQTKYKRFKCSSHRKFEDQLPNVFSYLSQISKMLIDLSVLTACIVILELHFMLSALYRVLL